MPMLFSPTIDAAITGSPRSFLQRAPPQYPVDNSPVLAIRPPYGGEVHRAMAARIFGVTDGTGKDVRERLFFARHGRLVRERASAWMKGGAHQFDTDHIRRQGSGGANSDLNLLERLECREVVVSPQKHRAHLFEQHWLQNCRAATVRAFCTRLRRQGS